MRGAQQSYPPAGVTAQRARPDLQPARGAACPVDRGGDPARAEQIRRYEDAANRQQAELDRTLRSRAGRAARARASSSFSAAAAPNNAARSTTRSSRCAAISTACMADLQRLQGAGAGFERDGQRRAVLAALAAERLRPAISRQAAATAAAAAIASSNLFGGPGSIFAPDRMRRAAGGGLSAPSACAPATAIISRSRSRPRQDRFRDDERDLPAHVPGRRGAAVLASQSGRGRARRRSRSADSSIANFRTPSPIASEYNSSCTCKRPGETWADAVKTSRRSPDHPGARRHRRHRRARQGAVAPRDGKGRPIGQSRAARRNGDAAAGAAPRAPEPEPVRRPTSAAGPRPAKPPVRTRRPDLPAAVARLDRLRNRKLRSSPPGR